MPQHLAHIALVVDDYDVAISYYTTVLNFNLLEDTTLSETKRWVLIAPTGGGCALLLAKAANEEQKTRIGNQTGGRVFLFLHTNSFDADYENLLAKNVNIIQEPTVQPHGRVLVFQDVYGNKWDLIEPKKK